MSERVSQSEENVSLRDTLISAGLAAHLADLLDQMPQRRLKLDPRQIFRPEGFSGNEVMFVRSGILSKFRSDGRGGRQIISLRFAGEGILPRRGSLRYGIRPIARSEVLVGDAADFQRLVDGHPEMQEFFLRLVERNEAICYEWLLNTGRRDCLGRVAHLLCETAVRMRAEPSWMEIPFTQQEIADITGQTSVNVNRVLMDMERDGLFSRNGRKIVITDWDALCRVGSFDPTYLAIDL